MAKKDGLYVSVGADVSNYKKSWDEIATVTKAGGKTLEQEAAAMALKVSKKIEGMGINTQARQLQNLTAKMMEAGLEGTKAFTQVAAAGGKLRAQMDDAKGVIEAMRPDAPFKALSTTLGAAAQGFAGVQGAMALFGAESEETQKVLLKVQAAMAFSEGFKALDGLQDGFTQLNLIIKANPLVAGITIFAAAAATLYAISEATDETAAANERLNKIQSKVFENTVKEKTKLEQLLRVYNNKNTTDAERLKIQKQLVDKYPEYLGKISTEKVEQDKVNAGVKSYISLLKKKAEAQILEEEYIELLREERAEREKIGSTWDIIQSGAAQTGKSIARINADKLELKLKAVQAEWDKVTGAAEAATTAQNTAFGNTTTTTSTGTGTGSPTKQAPQIINTKDVESISRMNLGIGAYGYNVEQVVTSTKDLTAGMQPLLLATQAQNSAWLEGEDALKKTAAAAAHLESQQANLKAVAEGAAGAFNTLGGVISQSMMDAAGNSATAMDVFKASIVETIIKLAGMAMANAIVGATQTGTATGAAAIFTTPAFITAAIAGITSAFGAAASFKPTGFAEGGVIPGSSYSGDRLLAPVNSGEVVLNTGQQNALLRLANGGGGSGSNLVAKFTGRDLLIMYDNARKDYNRG